MSVSKNHPVFTPARPKGVFAPKKVKKRVRTVSKGYLEGVWKVLKSSRQFREFFNILLAQFASPHFL